MPIFDQGFRAFEGTLAPPTHRFWTITKAGVRLAMKKKWTWVVVLLASIPFLVLLVTIYLRGTAEQAGNTLDQRIAATARDVLVINGERFWLFFFQFHAGFIVPMIVLFVGAGLIANDRRTNALEIYFSRPITKRDYIFGKLGIVLTFGLFVTLVEGVLLYVFHVTMKGEISYLAESYDLFLGIVACSLIITVPSAAAILAISSFVKSARFAGLTFFGTIMLTAAAGEILHGVTGTKQFWAVSYIANAQQLCTQILLDKPQFDFPWGVSLAVLVGITIVSFAVLWRRIRPVEIVS
ncbi:MAG: ABC transporter permease subunit [Planctomycetes bacterium]|nr:ABC transporter permease subunit [Planctomycetota bacterium]MBI3846585.1 ABC transporter permease subunit [Planctomycetota bacterium]